MTNASKKQISDVIQVVQKIDDYKQMKDETIVERLLNNEISLWGVLHDLGDQFPEICMAAVQRNGYTIKFVKDQTPEICLAAVKQNGQALEYVKKQTPEICLAAVQKCGMALEFVKKQTLEICTAAIDAAIAANMTEVIDFVDTTKFEIESLSIKKK
jgi:hypothetical protein